MPSTIIELTPQNRVILCANVPFDSTYTHTILFETLESQLNYFLGKKVYSWENLSTSRFPNKIRVPLSSSEVYNCNYMLFQNTNFGTKWLMGFITEIEYVNPTCCYLSVELDAFQTWQFEFEVGVSYVLREHPLTDKFGEHKILEPMNTGEYVNGPGFRSGHMDNYQAVVMYAKEDSMGDGPVGGTYTGLTYASAPATSGAILDLLQTLNSEGKASSVAATYLMPKDFYTTGSGAIEYNITKPFDITTLGDYTPRNKKLLCYPYNMLNVSDSMGNVNTYKWEYFGSQSAAIFGMSCAMGPNASVVIWPKNYNNQGEAFQESMSISGFPQFAYVNDTYRQWAAIHGNAYAFQKIGSAVNGAVGMAAAELSKNPLAPLSAAVALGVNVGTAMSGLAEQSKQPNTSAGAQDSDTMVGIRAKDFYFYQHHIREDYAETFDDYFDRFGYQTNRLKVPNLTGRPNYNYVQCAEADVHGNVPLGDINVIKQAFNRGITFWHNTARAGDYSLKNRPKEEDTE